MEGTRSAAVVVTCGVLIFGVLNTQMAYVSKNFEELHEIGPIDLQTIQVEGIEAAKTMLENERKLKASEYFCVGHTVINYFVDDYMISNPEVKQNFIKRAAILRGIREFLDNRGFIEVETPMLSPIAGGASARPFITHHNTLDIDMYLRIAPELYLKRAIVAGLEKVYDMGRTFRNEGMSVRHNPEFTMIELYEAFADYNDMMEIAENMIAYVCEKVNGTTKVMYQGTEIDFAPPWRRITMVDAVKEHTGIDFNEIGSDEEAQAIAKEKNLEFKKNLSHVTKGEVLNALYEEYCEQHMIQPTFICDYPVEISPLTKKKRGDEMFTERFEGFVFGREICNAYSELNDPIVQRERFKQQEKERELGDDEAYMIDEEFMSALETGMPPTGGLGIGIDRVIMFLTDSASIRDVIMFPTMKPVK